jgi:hypothetical protein
VNKKALDELLGIWYLTKHKAFMDYVEISPELHRYLGEKKSTTRIYQKSGSQEETGRWYDAVTAAVGPTISLGAVQLYCPVSRSALHERMDRGRLTVFEFTVTERRTNFLGQNKTIKKEPFLYVPVSECRSWRKDIEERAKEKGMTEREMTNANASLYDELDEQVIEEEKNAKRSRPAILTISLNQFEIDLLTNVSADLKYESGEKFAADILRPIINGGFSGLSCFKVGWWLSKQLEEHKVGRVELPKLIKNLRKLTS